MKLQVLFIYGFGNNQRMTGLELLDTIRQLDHSVLLENAASSVEIPNKVLVEIDEETARKSERFEDVDLYKVSVNGKTESWRKLVRAIKLIDIGGVYPVLEIDKEALLKAWIKAEFRDSFSL